MFTLLLLSACQPDPEAVAAADLQLENAAVSSEACADWSICTGDVLASGALAVTSSGGESSVDLDITVDETQFAVHSPTGADLSAFVGNTVSAAVNYDWMLPASIELTDESGVLYVLESGAGNAFSEIDVQYGEELGSLVDDADYKLTFHALDVTTDSGVVSVKPGEVVTVTIDGAMYRFGAIAAYETSTIPGGEYSDCGGESPMLSYEMVRVEADRTWTAIQRPASLEMAAFSGCGG